MLIANSNGAVGFLIVVLAVPYIAFVIACIAHSVFHFKAAARIDAERRGEHPSWQEGPPQQRPAGPSATGWTFKKPS